MKIKKDGVLLDFSKTPDKSNQEYASDDIVQKASEEIEEKYAEAFKKLADGPDSKL